MQQQKKRRITSKLIRQYDRGCNTCIHFHEEYNENSEDPIGMCTGSPNIKGSLGARGSRDASKLCGMEGKWYKRDPECGEPVINKRPKKIVPKRKRIEPPRPKQGQPPKLEEMTLDELEAIPRDELSIGEKAKLTKQINKLKKES